MINVFYYKGIIGIDCDPNSEGIIAKPGNGNLGVVCKADKVRFSKDAVDALKRVKRSHDAIGDVDIFSSNEGPIFSWLGGYRRMIKPDLVEGSRDYDASLITATDDVEIPEDFKAAVDGFNSGSSN